MLHEQYTGFRRSAFIRKTDRQTYKQAEHTYIRDVLVKTVLFLPTCYNEDNSVALYVFPALILNTSV